jgi:hypothetical protein
VLNSKKRETGKTKNGFIDKTQSGRYRPDRRWNRRFPRALPPTWPRATSIKQQRWWWHDTDEFNLHYELHSSFDRHNTIGMHL